MNCFLKGTLAAVIAAPMLGGIASAGTPVPFTWDPAQAVPSLPGSAFTADTIESIFYLHSFTGATGAFDRHNIWDIEGFRLNGQPVVAPGLNSAYNLYFASHLTGQGNTYDLIGTVLMADPTNNNGPPVTTITGVSFSNPAGVADDFVLGTGTLHSATLVFDPVTGIPTGHSILAFSPAPGQEDFFGEIGPFLENFSNTPPPALQVFPQPDGSVIAVVNGGIGRSNFIPEPGSLALLASGLLGLGMLRRLRNQRNRVLPG